MCIVYRNGVELADKDLIGKTVTCTLYRNLKKSKSFTVSGVTDDSYYTALLGYPPTLIVSDQVVKAFDAKAFILKTGIRYKKEYDRRTEEEIPGNSEERCQYTKFFLGIQARGGR